MPIIKKNSSRNLKNKITMPLEMVKKLGHDLVLRYSKKIPPIPDILITNH